MACWTEMTGRVAEGTEEMTMGGGEKVDVQGDSLKACPYKEELIE